ncbi:tetraacyldisaccharide 4'-kinase [Commensalibacter oyaizuii]|uniref:Tetraacyldisaccharide 4'-kinase n=1 Tax=Commensalibacter oyaizuii TaxID=3043873 RepID=A0ABT6Q2A9_9PROT|nr:tetraacyldisaccharide 4'-kinase [Commensalibacter sp. TBRC 16381]MDI2091264.1 tetraacyldisaccharide 4'-kinase [Commensalibacter sp. TBRC 16381]
MKAPAFWQIYPPTFMAKLLHPLSYITHNITRYRLSKPRWKASVPVICCGNLSVGGTGKTTLALDLGQYYQQQGIKIAFLTRGYKRKKTCSNPILVDPNYHTVHDVGDEALLLAQIAPTWVASNRALSAQTAIKHGAQMLIMDDGFQNPSLYQDLPLLIIDGGAGLGNHMAMPAGPLREALQDGLLRAKACILIGDDQYQIRSILPQSLPVFQAYLEMNPEIHTLAGQQVIAFAGIGRPDKFFQSLQDNKLRLFKTFSFPDHYHYQDKDIYILNNLRNRYNDISIVTTPKDYVKLPKTLQSNVIPLGVHLRWEDPMALQRLQALLNTTLVQDAGG